jgi:dUTP pyrophosphatase
MIRVQKIATAVDGAIQLPEFKTEGSVGFDLAASEDVTIMPGYIALVPTGLRIQVEEDGYFLAIVARSSLPLKKGLILANSIGIIDKDYCGPGDEIKLQLANLSTTNPVTVKAGERLCQGIILKHAQLPIEYGIDKDADRGGFGSTG